MSRIKETLLFDKILFCKINCNIFSRKILDIQKYLAKSKKR